MLGVCVLRCGFMRFSLGLDGVCVAIVRQFCQLAFECVFCGFLILVFDVYFGCSGWGFL